MVHKGMWMLIKRNSFSSQCSGLRKQHSIDVDEIKYYVKA